MRYVSLHSHSTYSYGDGYGLPKDHVERVAYLGMTALALTEHGNVSSHVKLEQAALKAGIKPIFGLEAYTAPRDMRETKNMRKWHQTLLAMDQEGYENLMRLTTVAWERDFYRWPTVLGDNLADNSAGLIATSGCADGHIACTMLGGKGIPEPETRREKLVAMKEAEKLARRYKRLLGDRFYLEVQRFPRLARTCVLNKAYESIGAEVGIELVASSDVHYPLPKQNEMQKILHAASRNTGTVAAAEAEWEYDILLTYPQSDEEILQDLVDTGLSASAADRAVDNTAVIAERCNVELPKMDRIRYPGTRRDLQPWPRKKR